MLPERVFDLFTGIFAVMLIAGIGLAMYGACKLVSLQQQPDDHETRMRKAVAWVRTHRLSTLDLRLHQEPERVSAKVLDTNGRVWVVELRCKQGEIQPASSACEAQP